MNEINLSGNVQIGKYLFVSITYNHEKYILEHLESIRYQIEHWGGGRSCSILIADDCSSDLTVKLSRAWLKVHKDIFASYKILENIKNEGTCANFIRIFPYTIGQRFKVLAGDDLYSYNNIFDLIDKASNEKLVSGLPLVLYAKGLRFPAVSIFNIIASEVIYSKNFLSAMKGFSLVHTPSLAYDEGALRIDKMAKFISLFDVVEDFAMQICLAEARPRLRYKVDDQFYVYYRRTNQSTYMIKNKAFIRDKKRLYRYLADREPNHLKKLMIRNRALCLNMKGVIKYIANINTYEYIINVIIKLPNILRRFLKIDRNLQSHYQYLKYIQNQVKAFADSDFVQFQSDEEKHLIET